LVDARETNPKEFPASEQTLLEKAKSVSVKELAARVRDWRIEADEGSGERERRLHERRRLDVYPTAEGTVAMRGVFDPLGGQTVITAVQAFVDEHVKAGDPRTPAQLRADANVEFARRYLNSPDRARVAGERPHLVVHVDLETLVGKEGLAMLENAGPISAETARMIACDAGVSRVIMKGASEPLDVGRKTPVVGAGLRKAVAIRDKGCAVPVCDRPASWTDGHHVVHWPDGGVTAKSNIVLLCRPHHGMVHKKELGVEMVDGKPVFRRADGTLIEDRAPP
jgi:hypothetical protein